MIVKANVSVLDIWDKMYIEEKEELIRVNKDEIVEILAEQRARNTENSLQTLAYVMSEEHAKELKYWLDFYQKG